MYALQMLCNVLPYDPRHKAPGNVHNVPFYLAGGAGKTRAPGCGAGERAAAGAVGAADSLRDYQFTSSQPAYTANWEMRNARSVHCWVHASPSTRRDR